MSDGLNKSNVQSFIVKIWIEETGEEYPENTWRGHITHVVSNKRRYVKSLDEIANYFQEYLALINQIE